jgi:L-lactate dehydrogenase complex protein LldF
MADLALFLKLLSRSSTGQPITVYTSLIHGPRRADDPDGPEQLHVVVLYGGRRKILSSEYSEVLRCIRCGACLNACPVYRKIGGHAYDSVYPGPIGKLLTPLMQDFEHYADLPQASSLCGLCYEVCPVKIDIPDVLVRLRRDQVRRRTAPWSRRFAFRMMTRVLSSPGWYRLAQRLGRAMTFFGSVDGWVRRLPGPMKAITAVRDVPRPAARSFRARWAEERGRGDDGPE